MARYYWKITLLDEPVWIKNRWYFGGYSAVSGCIEYGDSPIRDKKSRLQRIAELCEAGVNFTVERIDIHEHRSRNRRSRS